MKSNCHDIQHFSNGLFDIRVNVPFVFPLETLYANVYLVPCQMNDRLKYASLVYMLNSLNN